MKTCKLNNDIECLELISPEPTIFFESPKRFKHFYQKKGSQGFFILNLIHTFWLRFSSFLIRINLDNVLLALQGFTLHKIETKTLNVNVEVFSYFPERLLQFHTFRSLRGEAKYQLLKENQLNINLN